MSLYTSRSRTSSVTDHRLIVTCQLCRTTRKIFASSVDRILLWSCWQRQTVGPLKRPSSSTIASLHNIAGSVASCYKSHRLPTSLRPLRHQRIRGFTSMRYINRLFTYLLTYLLTLCGFINMTLICRLKSFHHSVESSYWLSSHDVIL